MKYKRTPDDVIATRCKLMESVDGIALMLTIGLKHERSTVLHDGTNQELTGIVHNSCNGLPRDVGS